MSNHYNFIAPIYDGLAKLVFGKAITKAQNQWLNLLPKTGKVLFVGGGSGETLKKIVQLKPELSVTYIEASSKMIAKSRKKLSTQELKQVEFVNQKVEEAKFENKYDAILTFFFFDLFPERKGQTIFDKLDQTLKIKGQWYMVDFNFPKTKIQQLIEKVMFFFFKITTAIESNSIYNYTSFFENTCYDLLAKENFYNHFIFSHLYCKGSSDKNWHAN